MKESTRYHSHQLFRDKLKLGGRTRILLRLATGFAALFVSIMAYLIAYQVPQLVTRFRSFSKLLYIDLQALLLLLGIVSSMACQSLFLIPESVAYDISGNVAFELWQLRYCILNG